MSINIGTASQAVGEGQLAVLKDVQFPEGFQAERIRAVCRIGFKNTSGAPAALVAADLMAALRILFGTNSITFGLVPQKRRHWLAAVAMDRLREYGIAMEEDDIQFVRADASVGEMGVMDPLTDAISAAGAPVADGATLTVLVEVSVPFVFVRAAEERHEWCPGATQMRQTVWTAKRGAGFSAAAKISGFEQDGPMSVLYLADIVPGNDEWHDLPLIYSTTETKRITAGPGGRLLSLWERSAIGDASTIPQFSLVGELDDGTEHVIHHEITAADVNRGRDREIGEGARDLNALATVLHRMRLGSKIDSIPVARRWLVRQIAQSPQELDLVFLVAPIHGDELTDIIATNVTDTRAGGESSVLLTSAAMDRRPNAPPTSAATSGVKIARKGGVDYEGAVGLLVSKLGNGQPPSREISIPASQRKALEGLVSIAGRDGKSIATKGIAAIAARIPGEAAITRSTSKQAERSPTALAVRGQLGGLVAGFFK